MIRDLLNWVAPGLATVLGGTALCLALTSTNIASDVATQSAATLQQAGYDWAELSLDMREVVLFGTTSDNAQRDDAIGLLSNLAAVRDLNSDVTIAPVAQPFALVASIDPSGIELSGAIPDQITRDLLLSNTDANTLDLRVRSGMPDRQPWVAGAQYVLDKARYFDQGRLSVSDLSINIEGRAKSVDDYRKLLLDLRSAAPEGLSWGTVAIAPALVSPYIWSAVSDGKRIDVTGFVPDDQTAERLRVASTDSLPVATGLALGSGEPAGFADLSEKLIRQLALLDYGSASITDTQSTLTGAPPNELVAQAITNELQSAGSIIVLDPPRIDDYWVSVSLHPGGALVFDGYAPDAETRDALGARNGANISWLKLGRGAPARYQSALDFGLAALNRMSEGRFALRDNAITLSGVAETGADYKALLETLQQEAPQGLVLAEIKVSAPRAAQYAWSVNKDTSGSIVLEGMVPSQEAADQLSVELGQTTTGTMTYASGEPLGFVTSATAAIGLIQWLDHGKIELDGTSWLISGTPGSAIDQAAIETEFVTRKLAAAGWSMALTEPAPTSPTISPYLWSAEKSQSGAITLSGHVPASNIKSYLAIHSGPSVNDTTEIATGAPEGFGAVASAALDAILRLDQGRAAFDGSMWSLTGTARDQAAADNLVAALDSAADTAGWTISIGVPDQIPSATKPYIWSATRADGGATVLEGLVPAEALQRFAAVRAGDAVTDRTTVDASAPAGFADDILAAIDALAALSDGSVRFDGAKWTIVGTGVEPSANAMIEAALTTASTPASDWSIEVFQPAAEPDPTPDALPVGPTPVPAVGQPEVDPDYSFSATRSADGAVTLAGQVPTDPALRYLTTIASADSAAVTVAEGAPISFLTSAETGLRAFIKLEDGRLEFVDGAWTLSGIAPDTAQRDELVSAIGADTAGNWSTDIRVAVAPSAPKAVPVEAKQPADTSACRAPLEAFSARNSILFQSGAALIAAESGVALDELAADLAACPDAVVHIEGHTDADGDEQLNLALSVARAEAVVEELIARDVNPARLYAVGYGEAKPIADNDTAAGKRQNRRIVVTVSDEHF